MEKTEDIPKSVWARVFVYYYDDVHEHFAATGHTRGALTPLLLSRALRPLAQRALYARPCVACDRIDAFHWAISRPLEDVVLPVAGMDLNASGSGQVTHSTPAHPAHPTHPAHSAHSVRARPNRLASLIRKLTIDVSARPPQPTPPTPKQQKRWGGGWVHRALPRLAGKIDVESLNLRATLTNGADALVLVAALERMRVRGKARVQLRMMPGWNEGSVRAGEVDVVEIGAEVDGFQSIRHVPDDGEGNQRTVASEAAADAARDVEEEKGRVERAIVADLLRSFVACASGSVAPGPPLLSPRTPKQVEAFKNTYGDKKHAEWIAACLADEQERQMSALKRLDALWRVVDIVRGKSDKRRETERYYAEKRREAFEAKMVAATKGGDGDAAELERLQAVQAAFAERTAKQEPVHQDNYRALQELRPPVTEADPLGMDWKGYDTALRVLLGQKQLRALPHTRVSAVPNTNADEPEATNGANLIGDTRRRKSKQGNFGKSDKEIARARRAAKAERTLKWAQMSTKEETVANRRRAKREQARNAKGFQVDNDVVLRKVKLWFEEQVKKTMMHQQPGFTTADKFTDMGYLEGMYPGPEHFNDIEFDDEGWPDCRYGAEPLYASNHVGREPDFTPIPFAPPSPFETLERDILDPVTGTFRTYPVSFANGAAERWLDPDLCLEAPPPIFRNTLDLTNGIMSDKDRMAGIRKTAKGDSNRKFAFWSNYDSDLTPAPDHGDIRITLRNVAKAECVTPPVKLGKGTLDPLYWLANTVPVLPRSVTLPIMHDDSGPVLASLLGAHLGTALATWDIRALNLVADDPVAARIFSGPLWPLLPVEHLRIKVPEPRHPLDVFRHLETGRVALNPKTHTFELEVNRYEADQRWMNEGIPAQVYRVVAADVDWDRVVPGHGEISTALPEDDEEESVRAPASDDYPSPTFSFASEASFVDVDTDEMELSGGEGEEWDPIAAERQERALQERQRKAEA